MAQRNAVSQARDDQRCFRPDIALSGGRSMSITQVGAVYPKATPVILTTPNEVEAWMTARIR